MNFGNRDYELADARFEMERATGIGTVQAALAGVGTSHCCDCGDAISAARRAAVPNTRRCAECQGAWEAVR